MTIGSDNWLQAPNVSVRYHGPLYATTHIPANKLQSPTKSRDRTWWETEISVRAPWSQPERSSRWRGPTGAKLKTCRRPQSARQKSLCIMFQMLPVGVLAWYIWCLLMIPLQGVQFTHCPIVTVSLITMYTDVPTPPRDGQVRGPTAFYHPYPGARSIFPGRPLSILPIPALPGDGIPATYLPLNRGRAWTVQQAGGSVLMMSPTIRLPTLSNVHGYEHRLIPMRRQQALDEIQRACRRVIVIGSLDIAKVVEILVIVG